MHILIAYATTDGQTALIARRIGEHIRALGHDATVSDIRQLPREVPAGAYDGAILSGSVHAQGYQRRLRAFVEHNGELLRSVPTAFVSVCLAVASKKQTERDAARTIAEGFVAKAGWKPHVIEVVAGALTFSRYGFLRRGVMKRIAVREMGVPVDTTRDYELTDWDQVARFARRFVEQAGQLGKGATAGDRPDVKSALP